MQTDSEMLETGGHVSPRLAHCLISHQQLSDMRVSCMHGISESASNPVNQHPKLDVPISAHLLTGDMQLSDHDRRCSVLITLIL